MGSSLQKIAARPALGAFGVVIRSEPSATSRSLVSAVSRAYRLTTWIMFFVSPARNRRRFSSTTGSACAGYAS